jgi:hypothetical protein
MSPVIFFPKLKCEDTAESCARAGKQAMKASDVESVRYDMGEM